MIVLDTHTLIWWVDGGGKLTEKASKIIEREMEAGAIVVSSISSWEVSMLVEKGRLKLDIDIESWLKRVHEIPNVSFLPIDNKIAIESTRLPGEFHKDPADRMIVATARVSGATLITADEKILKYEYVKTVWN